MENTSLYFNSFSQHSKTTDWSSDNESVESTSSTPRHVKDFFADSPYYNAFVEKEIYNLETMTTTIKDVVDKAKEFSKTGSQMAIVTRNLAASCRFGPEFDHSNEALHARRKALGHDMASSLEHLGEVLDEVASAQEHMCQIFERCLAVHMESHTMKEARTIKMMEEATHETEEAERVFFQYINGKYAGGNFSDVNRSSLRQEIEVPALTKRLKVVGWKHDLHKVCLQQTCAEIKRFQLARRITQTKIEQNRGLSNVMGQLMTEMCTCFTHCGDLAKGILPLVKDMEEKCKQSQLDHETKDFRNWQERENKLVDALASMQVNEAKAHDDLMKIGYGSQTPKRVSLTDKSIARLKQFDIRSLEEKCNIWNLPSTLASLSNYNRPRPPGVLVEGWLYRKTSTLLHAPTWNRAWFVLKGEGIFAFWSSDELRREKGNSSIAKEKVCDVELCTVRTLADNDPSARFRFELIVSKFNKPILLQARGPQELRKWVDGIRTAISQQLTVGNFNKKNCRFRDSLFKMDRRGDSTRMGRNRRGVVRQSTEVRSTILEMKEVIMKNPDKQIEEEASETEEAVVSSSEDELLDPVVKQLMDANPVCADCSISAPDWVSLNLGILICLQCSGVHRSLGVHVSKVRSLRLDSLSNRESSLLLALGNDRVNRLWEKQVSPGREKPGALDSDRFRESWIKSKYIRKEFTGFALMDEEQASRDIYDASRRGDILGIMEGLIRGGSVKWKNEEEENQTHIDVCGLDVNFGGNTAECMELLMQNGAKLNSLQDLSALLESKSSLGFDDIQNDSPKFQSLEDPSESKLIKPKCYNTTESKLIKPKRTNTSESKLIKPKRTKSSELKLMKPKRTKSSELKLIKPKRTNTSESISSTESYAVIRPNRSKRSNRCYSSGYSSESSSSSSDDSYSVGSDSSDSDTTDSDDSSCSSGSSVEQ